MGWSLIGYGIFEVLYPPYNIIGGIWIAFVGWFLSHAADVSRKEITLREHLSSVKVKDVMSATPEVVSPDAIVEEVVWDIFRKHHGRAVPVCRDGRLVGILTITDVKELPRDKWGQTKVSEIMTREPLYTVSPEDTLRTALKMIAEHDINQVLIDREGQCAGVLGRADIIGHIQFSQELGMSR